jgi:hypothetical protein
MPSCSELHLRDASATRRGCDLDTMLGRLWAVSRAGWLHPSNWWTLLVSLVMCDTRAKQKMRPTSLPVPRNELADSRGWHSRTDGNRANGARSRRCSSSRKKEHSIAWTSTHPQRYPPPWAMQNLVPPTADLSQFDCSQRYPPPWAEQKKRKKERDANKQDDGVDGGGIAADRLSSYTASTKRTGKKKDPCQLAHLRV